jgi:prepilin-type N-terminal cleavage/methylation domain-containing protein
MAPPGRRAFSLIEVMVAIALLTIAMSGLIGAIANLSHWDRAERDVSQVQLLAQVMAERIQGGTWANLGQTIEPWSWHRREVPRPGRPAPVVPPLTETDTTAMVINGQSVQVNNLVALGILAAPTGLRNLKVYLEYYRSDAVSAAGGEMVLRPATTYDGTAHPALIFPWRASTATDADMGFPENPDAAAADHINLAIDPLTGTQNNDAVIVRIAVQWEVEPGDIRTHQVLVARRQ